MERTVGTVPLGCRSAAVFATWLWLALLAAGCETNLLGSDIRLSVRTDREEYRVERIENAFRVDLLLTLRNHGDVAVFTGNCGGVMDLELRKWEGGAWVPAWRPYLPLCLSIPLEIRPGGSHRHRLGIVAYLPESGLGPGLEVAGIEGTYAIVVNTLFTSAADAPDRGDTRLPLAKRTSNAFELRLR